MRFEIHAHTMFSNIRLIDCINHPKKLIQKAYELGYSGITITDHEALCGHIDWLNAEKDLKEQDVISQDFKCALGNEIYLTNDRETMTYYPHFLLIAKNTEGHKALRELSSIAWYNSFSKRGMERVPTTKNELQTVIKKYPNSIIATTACLGGELAHLVEELIELEKKNNQQDIYLKKYEIKTFLDFCIDLFGDDFYIEIAPAASKDQIKYNKRVIEIADALKIKLVFGCDAHYYTANEREVHKAYLNSKDGEREVDDFYYYSHLMSDNEAYENCKTYMSKEKFQNICETSVDIYNKIDTYNLFHKPIIPFVQVKNYNKHTYKLYEYPILQALIDSDNIQERYWINQCLEALESKSLWSDIYLKRLEEEADILNVISEKLENCMYEYFNTFQHYIDLFWECGTVVGPGRGSASCFLSNYLLGIVQLDAIKWDLPVFRFLNKDRIELPDIDIDLAATKRPKILSKIREERGELNVLQVATFGTETSKSAIKTGCRGYRGKKLENGKWEYPNGIDIDIANYLSSMVPVERGFAWSISEMVNGNEEKDRSPKKEFINELNKYPGLLDIIISIEGLVSRRGQHASGIMLYNSSPIETNAIMRSPNGDLTTQFDLHMSELLGDTKFDFLVTEVCDKIIACIELLKKDNYFNKNESLREIYNKNFHPEVIDINNKQVWDAIKSNKILDLFQFDSQVGRQGIQQVQPNNIYELLMTNALIRLVGEKGKERPMDRYVRIKNNIDDWYSEMRQYGLSENEIKILEPHYKQYYGTPTTQESLMLVCLDKNIANFTLKEANNARKIVSKKKIKDVAELHEKFVKSCANPLLGQYVWETCMEPQMSYAFATPHATAYSLIGYQVAMLATLYPIIYWNCACLIVNSGGAEYVDEDLIEGDMYEDIELEENEEEQDDIKKKKNKNTDYGRVASAIGKMKMEGIEIAPPNINKSSFTFSPDVSNSVIRYGIRGIVKIGNDIIKNIINNRPYESIQDFLDKVKVNKPQMINLIKSGAFDEFDNRVNIMKQYIYLISDIKKRITLQNMKMLIDFNLIPEEFNLQCKVYNFNKYVKKFKHENYYLIDNIAFNFYEKHFDIDKLETTDLINSGFMIKQRVWDTIYQKHMDIIRPFVKANNEQLLNSVNNKIISDMWNKYCDGTLSKWEMDSISYYYHDHELEEVNEDNYDLIEFFDLPLEPELDKILNIKGKQVPMYKIRRIMGTVIDKNKVKKTVSLLTKKGVVIVKIYGDVYTYYDKQISQKNEETGKKKVIEKSIFTRGNKIIVCGMRTGENEFLAKKYKNTSYHLIEQITSIKNGKIKTRGERVEV